MKRYNLVNRVNNKRISGVIIDESFKEEFKKLMNWTEYEWAVHTIKVLDEK